MINIDPALLEDLKSLAVENETALVNRPMEGEQPPVHEEVTVPMSLPTQSPIQNSQDDLLHKDLQNLNEENNASIMASQTPKGSGEGKGTTQDFMSGIATTIQNAASGGNRKLADAIGTGLHYAFFPMSSDKSEILSDTRGGKTLQERQDDVANVFNSLGISAKTNDSTANKIGQEIAKSLPELATLYASAPALAAKEGITAGAYLAREIGTFTQKHPWLTLLQSIGADTGAVTATEATGSQNPLVAMGGAVAGGIAATGAAKLGEKAVAKVTKLITPTPTLPADALRPYGAEPELGRQYAQHAVEGAQMRMQKAVDDAIESVPSSGSPELAQAVVRKQLDRAERIGNRIVSQFWERVPLKERVPMQPIKEAITTMRAEVAERPSQAPIEWMDKLYDLSLPIRDPSTGKMVKSLPTIERLRDLRGEIRRARVTEMASPAPNDGMIRNYNRLESIIDDGIQRAFPNDVTIDQARNASIKYHDLFSRGPIADVLARRSRGDAVVPPGQTTDALLGQYGGVQSLVDVRNKLVYKRAPGGANFAVTPQERQELQALTQEAEQSIRNMFRETAEVKGPQAASTFVGKHAKAIEPLARVHGELQFAASKLNATLSEQKTLQQTALAKYASSDPRISTKRLWTSPNPTVDARQVMLTLKNDLEALQGFKASFVDELLTRTAGDPIRMRNTLGEPKINSLYRTVLGDDGMNRLEKNVDIALRLARGDERLLRNKISPAARLMFGVMGAGFGRQVAHVTGGGSVQVPGMFANSFRKLSEKLFKVMNPDELLIQAIIDPKWERILYQRMPMSTKEARESIKNMRRFLGIVEGGRIAAQNALGDEND